VAVVPADATIIPATNGIYIGGTGNITVTMANGQNVTFNTIPVGYYKFSVTKVMATGTTATNILALY
jgi:hypothetical protein